MAITVGVRFRPSGKVYDFAPGNLSLRPGEKVVVETARGLECGEVVSTSAEIGTPERPLKPVLRLATEEDRKKAEENARKEEEAVRICRETIEAHGLDMKLVDAEYAFDDSKILFNFTAEGRVDFRDLVKDLAARFHTRIELHQIGVRDEAKKLGGIGICGRPFCCSQFLRNFDPVSIKMAKEQGLSLNPTKISGSCGRLMCCLTYEQSTYEELLKIMPKNGALVNTPEGRGIVVDTAVLAGTVKVRLEKAPDSPPTQWNVTDITLLDNRPNKGNNQPRPKAEPKAEAKAEAAPAAPAGEAPKQAPRQEGNGEKKPGGNNNRNRRNRHRGGRGHGNGGNGGNGGGNAGGEKAGQNAQ